MYFTSTRIITADIKRMVSFYEKATGQACEWLNEDFAELRTPIGTLAIGSTRTVPIAVPGGNKSVIIEFRVDNVDEYFKNLADAEVLQPPTTMPWGNRSILFKDPDGNLINFFTPVTEAAIQRYGL